MNKSKCPTVQSPYTVNPRNPCNIYIQTAQKKKRGKKKMEAKAIPSKPSSHQTTQQNHVPPFSLDATMRSLPPSPQRIDRSPWTRRKIRHAILISRFSSKIHNDKVEGSGGDVELQSRIRYFRSIKRSQMGRVDATRSSRYA